MTGGFAHVVLAVSDVALSVDFYESVVGLEREGAESGDREPSAADLYWLAARDGRLGLAHDPAGTPGDERDAEAALRDRATLPGAPLDLAHMALTASPGERDAVVRRLHERGRSYYETPEDVYFRDPDGNLVAVTSRPSR